MKLRVGSSEIFEQSDLTLIPAINGSTISFGPTRREVPESITALYFDASITVDPYDTDLSASEKYFYSTTL